MKKDTVLLSDIVVKNGLQTGPFGSQLKLNEFTSLGVPIVMPKDIRGGKISEDTISRTSMEKTKKLTKHQIKAGDIIFPRRGDLGRIAVATESNEGWICGTGCLRARIIESIDKNYIHQYVQIPFVVKWLEANALGQTMLNLNTKILGSLPIYCPDYKIQKHISRILAQWDTAIQKTEALIAAKKKRFGWLVAKLLLRNPNAIYWKTKTFGQYIEEKKEKSSTLNLHPCLTSSRRGIFLQNEYFSKQIASKNNVGYKVLNRGDFTFRSMSDDGMFVFNRQDITDKGLISPAYGVFSPNKNIDSDFLYYFLNSTLFNHVLAKEVQGGTRTALKLNALKKLKVHIPEMSEQKRIALILNTAKKEITLLEKLAEKYRLQKKGIMQKLLTGEWRVKSNDHA